MKILLLVFSALLVLLLAGLWVGPGSYPERWKIDERKTVQSDANQIKKDQIEKIRAELKDVSSGHEAVEERARSELGMIKKGETFYEVSLDKIKKTEMQKKGQVSNSSNPSSKTSSNQSLAQ